MGFEFGFDDEAMALKDPEGAKVLEMAKVTGELSLRDIQTWHPDAKDCADLYTPAVDTSAQLWPIL